MTNPSQSNDLDLEAVRTFESLLESPAAPTSAGEPSRAIQVVGVEKRFGHHHVLKGVSFSVDRAGVMCIIGPSGSGKSTLLRCINGLEPIDAGAVYIDDQLIGYRRQGEYLYPLRDRESARQRRRVGMVFQSFNLFPHMTARQNVTFAPRRILGQGLAEANAVADELLASVGVHDKADQFPERLSGGQQQRVAIARALAMRPTAMLFDEPTSALDPEFVHEVLTVMRELAQAGMTMVVVTHEMGFARAVGTQLLLMDDGAVIESGTPAEVIENPQTDRARAFLSQIL